MRIHNDLLAKKCVACEGGIPPLNREEVEKYMAETEGWVLNEEATKISKEYKFKDFIGAINFINSVAEIAEMEGHHPDIHLYYNRVILDLYTHAINGLHENDFILAAKIDASRATI